MSKTNCYAQIMSECHSEQAYPGLDRRSKLRVVLCVFEGGLEVMSFLGEEE